MTARCESIFWIVIVFVFVSSTHSEVQGDSKAICYRNVSFTELRYVPYEETYSYYVGGWCWLRCWETRTRTAYNPVYATMWSQKQTCCPGYEETNRTCGAKCPSMCMNGYCEQSDVCKCNYGWNGTFCNEPLVCSIGINSTGSTSDFPLLENVPIVNANVNVHGRLPECQSKCRNQISSTTANITRSEDGLFYFIPSDSPCDLTSAVDLVSWKKYSILIGAVIGTILFAVAACAVYILRQKRRAANRRTNEPPQITFLNYMEENEIYS